jgi:hypothetical protein
MLCLVADAKSFSFVNADRNGIIDEGDAEVDDGVRG